MTDDLRLPKSWNKNTRLAILDAIGMAWTALLALRGRCENGTSSDMKVVSMHVAVDSEISLLRRQNEILKARMSRIDALKRPRYLPQERMSILELKAARGWTNVKTAEEFLIERPETIAEWLKDVNQPGTGILVKVPEPVNKYPEYVQALVKRLKSLCPLMGKDSIAQRLGREGLHLAATTVKRIVKKPGAPEPEPRPAESEEAPTSPEKKRTVVAKYPGHVYNMDITVVPTRAGFWIPWFPFTLAQRWPFCWWVFVVVDQFSRRVVAFAVFKSQPTAKQICAALDKCVKRIGRPPKYTVSDKGPQFDCHTFRAWCAAQVPKVRPRYGAVGKYGSIAITERFIRSFKDECMSRIIVPMALEDMRRETLLYVEWYNEYRPNQGLAGRTPEEVFDDVRLAANTLPRFEPRERYPASSPCAAPQAPVRGPCGVRLDLVVSYLEGREHLPIVELRKVA